jgi:multidrug efflux system membrane fusion protein
LGAALLSGCTGEKREAPAQRPPVPVTTAQVTQKDMPLVLKAIGRAEAYATVSVTSRVSGQLLKVHFEQGNVVKEGQLLFTIDPAPYQASLDQALANLQRDLAKLKEAEVDVKRYEGMVKRDFVSQQQYDEKVTEAAALRATVKADDAQIKTARLNLSYCTIDSPITGRTGKLLVNAGNQIQAGGSNALVVINQVQPIYVSFSLPEKDLPQVRQYQGKDALLVEAKAPGEGGQTSMGHLSFIDNQVDESTGTILMRGTFTNSANLLWPGQFLNVTITLAIEKDALTVPNQAVREGPEGKIIFLVGKDNKVEIRPAKVKRVVGPLAVLGGGVQAGDNVVVDGHLLLYPGAVAMEKKIPPTQQSLEAQQKDATRDSQEKKEKQAKKQAKPETAQEGKQKK